MKTIYTASATTHGGWQGQIESSDGILDLDLTTPEEMVGGGGYAACFESALRSVASQNTAHQMRPYSNATRNDILTSSSAHNRR